MKIKVAPYRGMCFGVEDAIHLATHHPNPGQLTILGELVHNPSVLDALLARGIKIEEQLDNVVTSQVMITAHGTSEKTLQKIRDRGFQVLQATCPLVTHAHRAVSRLVREGCYPVIIGKAGHIEVRGLTGDLSEFAIVLSENEIDKLPEKPRFGVVAQTTQPIDKVRFLVDRLQQRFPKSVVRFLDTVCQPTKQRQSAAVELAESCTAVVVIGGSRSNNTLELVSTCQRFCQRVHHVQTASGLRQEWFRPDDVVGVTAGTSTPEEVVQEVLAWLKACTRAVQATEAEPN